MSDFDFDKDEFEDRLLKKHGIRSLSRPNDNDSELIKFVKLYEFVPETVKWLREHGFKQTHMNSWKKEVKKGEESWQMRVDPRGTPRNKNLPYDIAVIHRPDIAKSAWKIKHDQMIYDPYVKGMEQLDEAYKIFEEYIGGVMNLNNFKF